MRTYVIFDLETRVAFFGRARNETDALHRLTTDVEEYADYNGRAHELMFDEIEPMRLWIDAGQKSDEWPFEWRAT